MAAKLVFGGVYSLLVATRGKKRKTEDADPDDEGREFVGSYMSSRDANYYRGMGNGIGAAVAAMVRTAMAAMFGTANDPREIPDSMKEAVRRNKPRKPRKK